MWGLRNSFLIYFLFVNNYGCKLSLNRRKLIKPCGIFANPSLMNFDESIMS